jgi:hypothetical protein
MARISPGSGSSHCGEYLPLRDLQREDRLEPGEQLVTVLGVHKN